MSSGELFGHFSEYLFCSTPDDHFSKSEQLSVFAMLETQFLRIQLLFYLQINAASFFICFDEEHENLHFLTQIANRE